MIRLAAAGLAASLFAVAWHTPPARALSLCGCCAQAPAVACAKACAAVKDAGQCPATVAFDDLGEDEAGANPLVGTSLKALALDHPTTAQLERFRRFLEKHRRRAVRAYERAARKYQRGRLSREEMDKARAVLDEALVNYQHGIRAYLVRIGRKTE